MIGSKVLLPVSSAAFAELSYEVTARGQIDRLVEFDKLDLSDVVIVCDQSRKLSPMTAQQIGERDDRLAELYGGKKNDESE